MKYPDTSRLGQLSRQIELYAQLKHELGADGAGVLAEEAEKALKSVLERIIALSEDPVLAAQEPDELEEIKKLRPEGPRRLWKSFDEQTYRERVNGALLARFAGCTLGAIVECWSVDRMESWAEEIGDAFPPVDYWSEAFSPRTKRYGMSYAEEYTRGRMDGVPVDDDLAYTLLGLLIAEDFGADFSIEQAGEAWLKYLPYAATAEREALKNLREGISPRESALRDNPYRHWIGADIRSDPWAYIAPGYPEKAASMAYNDAYLSHRRNGIYGEMFFSAAISAAFAVNDAPSAFKIGLTEIPAECQLAVDVAWALEQSPEDFREARKLVDERFEGMDKIHTNNNACLTIFGLLIGQRDVTAVLSQTVAMGLDNDCTTATAGSLVGALVGGKGIPEHWHRNFHNTIRSYINGHPRFRIDELVDRFTIQAKRVIAG